MDYSIVYTKSTNCFITKTNGKMNADDFIKMAESLLDHTKSFPGANVLFDHTSLDFKDVSVDDLQKIREFHMSHEEKIGNGKSAMLLKTGLSKEWYHLWSQGEKIKTQNRVQVFEDYNDALGWLTT